MTRDFDPKMSSPAGEADGPPDNPAKPGRPGVSKETTKLVILLALVAVGGLVVAYQFLWANGPKTADAVSTATPAQAASASADAQNGSGAATPRAEAADAGADSGAPESELSVDNVEDLARRLDTYVQERQLALKDLHSNPFEVLVSAAATKEAGTAGTKAGAKVEAGTTAPLRPAFAGRLTLGSVMITGARRLAIINGKLYHVGDVVEGCTVEAIEPGIVRLSYDGEEVELSIVSTLVGPKGN